MLRSDWILFILEVYELPREQKQRPVLKMFATMAINKIYLATTYSNKQKNILSCSVFHKKEKNSGQERRVRA